MTNDNQEKVLRFMLEKAGNASIKVKGYSMFPELSDGDTINLQKCQKYNIGDILVYNYNGEGLLVHRLLNINEQYVCKGDYAFRFEEINESAIIGKVTFINGKTVKQWDPWKNDLSYEIGKVYSQSNSIEEAKNTSLYKLYHVLVLKEPLDAFIFCSEVYKSISFSHNHLLCRCAFPDGQLEEYRDIDSNIIFSAIPKQSIESFLNRIYGFYPSDDQILINKILTRLCKLVQRRVLTIQ